MTKEYNIVELEKFLREHIIPEIKANPKTFLGIAKQPHYENVLSNIYAFYFNPSEEHGLDDLFVKSFVEVINLKRRKFEKQDFSFVNDFGIDTEYPTEKDEETGKKGRIDLLLISDNDAIIIENKVYHILNNNLQNYWDTIDVSNKIGVLLSLKTMSTTSDHFINITHLEFLNKVMENSGSYLLDATDKYLVFLKDLYQNIINLSNQMETEDIQFYYKHQEKLKDFINLENAVKEQAEKQVEECFYIVNNDLNESLSFHKPLGNNGRHLRYYKSEENPSLMFTIIYGDLFVTDMKFYIIIEICNDAILHLEEIKLLDIKYTENETYTRKDWLHLVRLEYEVNDITEDNIKDLSKFIIDEIKDNGLISIFNKIDAFLTGIRLNKQK